MKYYNKSDVNRIIILILITIVALGWTIANADGFILPAVIYIILGAIAIFGYLVYNKIGKKSYIFGISNNYGRDIIFGVCFGVGFILLRQFNIIGSILIPYVPASITQESGRIIIIVLGAMVIESAIFLGFLVPFFDEKLKEFGINIPFLVALTLACLISVIFHATSYGQVGATMGSYVSAFIFFFISGLIMYKTKSLLPLVISHGIINFSALNDQYGYFKIALILLILNNKAYKSIKPIN
jgi:membrane protease YdiL (CAAX protease family)